MTGRTGKAEQDRQKE
jgi:hypothetical protein